MQSNEPENPNSPAITAIMQAGEQLLTALKAERLLSKAHPKDFTEVPEYLESVSFARKAVDGLKFWPAAVQALQEDSAKVTGVTGCRPSCHDPLPRLPGPNSPNCADFVMDLREILEDLYRKRREVERAIIEVESLAASVGTRRSCRGRKFMPMDERREVSERMKRYWAHRRQLAENSGPE
jgi:hypothetical protein